MPENLRRFRPIIDSSVIILPFRCHFGSLRLLYLERPGAVRVAMERNFWRGLSNIYFSLRYCFSKAMLLRFQRNLGSRNRHKKGFSVMVMLGPVEFDMSLLRYNLTDRKTLQSHKFNYFINQRVMFLTRNDS